MSRKPALPRHLTKISYPHEYPGAPGAHEWGYWDLHVQEAIAFHARTSDRKGEARRARSDEAGMRLWSPEGTCDEVGA